MKDQMKELKSSIEKRNEKKRELDKMMKLALRNDIDFKIEENIFYIKVEYSFQSYGWDKVENLNDLRDYIY